MIAICENNVWLIFGDGDIVTGIFSGSRGEQRHPVAGINISPSKVVKSPGEHVCDEDVADGTVFNIAFLTTGDVDRMIKRLELVRDLLEQKESDQ